MHSSADSDDAAVLQVSGITAGYDPTVAILQDVSFTCRRGEIVAILGPNGAGKSTLLKSVGGILAPFSGRVMLDGVDVTGQPARNLLRNGCVFVPQESSLFPYMTGKENLQLGGLALNISKAELERRIALAMDFFPEITDRLNTSAGNLSGGQQKILELSRALIATPKLCLLDEPTAGLAPRVAETVYRAIKRMSASQVGVVLVDQYMTQALAVGDRAEILNLGRIAFSGTCAEATIALPSLVRSWMGTEGAQEHGSCKS
ncbi:MAG: ABC transporter ATP-binding protein [Lautropia sp.]